MRADRLRLPKDLVTSVAVARLARELRTDTYHAARVVQLARRLFRAGERYTNTGKQQDDERWERMRKDLADYLDEHSPQTHVDTSGGLWPSLYTFAAGRAGELRRVDITIPS